MPDPERLLFTLRRAMQAFRAAPGRRGRFVQLSGGPEADVLVAGDMHGNLENFRRLLLRADLAKNPQRHLVLQEVIHGPFYYPDGNDKSHQLLDLVCALKVQYPQRVHFLLGNHELAQATNCLVLKKDADQNRLFHQGVLTAYGRRGEEVYAAYLELLAVVPVALRTDNRVYLSHSLPSATRLEAFNPVALEQEPSATADLVVGGSIHSLVWGRDTRAENVQAFLHKVDAALLISGHIPCEEGFEVPNDRQLILDSLGYPAAFVLFPLHRPLTHAELVGMVGVL
jgi:hypothetical protein